MLSRPNPPLDPSSTPVRRKPSLDFSITGLVFVAMLLFMGLAAVNSQANLLFGVLGLMLGVLIVSMGISRIVMRKLEITRGIPEHAVVGERTVLTYELKNAKRFWPSLSVTVSELDGSEAFTRQPLAYMLHAAPGMTAVVPTEVIPKRRGLHTFDRFQVATSFPFGFIKRALERRHRETILIYPAIGHVDPALLRQCQSAEKSGAMLRPRRGGQDEFYGIKEFRNGDNPRLIHWKRSAHTGVLVSKEMTLVSPPRLQLVLDTRLQNRSLQAHALVEKTLAMAGSLATHALEAGLMVGLSAWSGDWIGISPNRGKRHRHDLMTALARLSLNTEHGSEELLSHARSLLKSGTTAVLLTPNPAQSSLADQAKGTMVVVSPLNPESDAWFEFDPEIEFGRCMPIEQQPVKKDSPTN